MSQETRQRFPTYTSSYSQLDVSTELESPIAQGYYHGYDRIAHNRQPGIEFSDTEVNENGSPYSPGVLLESQAMNHSTSPPPNNASAEPSRSRHGLAQPPDVRNRPSSYPEDISNKTITQPRCFRKPHIDDASPRSLLAIIASWRWELFTLLLSTLAGASIFTILMYFDGKPSDKWHFVFQLTTVVSILSQIVTEALLASITSCIGQLKWTWFQRAHVVGDLEMLDDASRGLEGSIKLLWKIPIKLFKKGAWDIYTWKMHQYVSLT